MPPRCIHIHFVIRWTSWLLWCLVIPTRSPRISDRGSGFCFQFVAVVYEEAICRVTRVGNLKPEDFKVLYQDGKLPAFRAAVDENYRYHQFWGAMSLIFPNKH